MFKAYDEDFDIRTSSCWRPLWRIINKLPRTVVETFWKKYWDLPHGSQRDDLAGQIINLANDIVVAANAEAEERNPLNNTNFGWANKCISDSNIITTNPCGEVLLPDFGG